MTALAETDSVVLVVPATDLDQDLADLLPLVGGKTGAVVVTYWDKIGAEIDARGVIGDLESELGVPRSRRGI